MRKKIGYKHGYKIIISDRFYEVIDGRTAVYYGQCNKTATVQEIANDTILKEDANVSHRRKRFGKVTGREISGRNSCRRGVDEAKDVIGM